MRELERKRNSNSKQREGEIQTKLNAYGSKIANGSRCQEMLSVPSIEDLRLNEENNVLKILLTFIAKCKENPIGPRYGDF